MFFKGNYPFQPVNRDVIKKQVEVLYPQLHQQRKSYVIFSFLTLFEDESLVCLRRLTPRSIEKYDEIYYKQREMAMSHYRDPKWPPGIDEWQESHRDGSSAVLISHWVLRLISLVSV